MKVFLDWPYGSLWPNNRPHWASKAKATQAYRFAAKVQLRNAALGPIRITFCPKSRGPMPDMDNCIASFKAGQDGIADALGVNDRRFRPHPHIKDEIGGMVRIRLTPGPMA